MRVAAFEILVPMEAIALLVMPNAENLDIPDSIPELFSTLRFGVARLL